MQQENKATKVYSGRDTTADLLKGIAVVLMIQVHLVELFATNEIFHSEAGKFLLFLGGPPAAPLFMVIMGYFLFYSNRSFEQQVLRGLKLIGGGLLLNIGLNFHLLVRIYSGSMDLNPYRYIFGSDILPLAGLSIIIIAFIRKYFRRNVFVFAAVGILVLILTPLLPDLYNDYNSPLAYLQAFFWGGPEWSYFPLFPWLFYPIAGYITALIKPELQKFITNKKLILYAGAAAVIILIFTFDYGISVAANLPEYYHHNIIYAGWIVLFLLIIIPLVHEADKLFKFAPIIIYTRWIGRNVTLFYIFQWLIIGNIATAVYRTQGWLQLLLWFGFIMIAVTMMVIIYNHFEEKHLSISLKNAGN